MRPVNKTHALMETKFIDKPYASIKIHTYISIYVCRWTNTYVNIYEYVSRDGRYREIPIVRGFLLKIRAGTDPTVSGERRENPRARRARRSGAVDEISLDDERERRENETASERERGKDDSDERQRQRSVE